MDNIMNKKLISITLLAVLAIVIISGCTAPEEVHTLNYNGRLTSFRADLNKARLVPVHPSESVIEPLFLNPSVKTINLTFVDNFTENGFYAVGAYELTYKLTIIKNTLGLNYNITVTPVESPDQMIPLNDTVYIFLAGPSQSDETSVRVVDNKVFVNARSFAEINRKYTDLDLSIDKILLLLMEDKS
jgi:hypothetical protein